MPTITCTTKQLHLIETCVEAMFRMSMGQFQNGLDDFSAIVKRDIDHDDMKDLENRLRLVIFPELVEQSVGGFAAYGYRNDKIGDGKILGEMSKVFQNFRAVRDNHPESSCTHNKPMKASNEPFIEVRE